MLLTRFSLTLILAAAALLTASSAPSRAADIRDKVIKETILDEQIALFCKMKCVGNQSEGTLKTLTLEPIDKDNYAVFGIAALRNRHVLSEYTVYDHTVYVSSHGTLDSRTCKVKVQDARVDNDYNGIFTSLLRSESDVIGKTFAVPNCRKFIDADSARRQSK
ncbi:MAG TPA: hypothetical protein PKC29_15300 [Thermodesulfobacteriota bacterium]|nr:hypothetical protein [Thermodesulfobacteriota bacterium]